MTHNDIIIWAAAISFLLGFIVCWIVYVHPRNAYQVPLNENGAIQWPTVPPVPMAMRNPPPPPLRQERVITEEEARQRRKQKLEMALQRHYRTLSAKDREGGPGKAILNTLRVLSIPPAYLRPDELNDAQRFLELMLEYSQLSEEEQANAKEAKELTLEMAQLCAELKAMNETPKKTAKPRKKIVKPVKPNTNREDIA